MSHARIILVAILLGIGAAQLLADARAEAPAAAVNPLPMTGAELSRSIRICEKAGIKSSDVANWRACSGYLAGILNGTSATADLLGSAPFFCIPDGTRDADLQRGIADYIDAHPASAEAPTVTAVIDAIVVLYPCKRNP